jgi:thiol-disulfide isomerase/thioredoxin
MKVFVRIMYLLSLFPFAVQSQTQNLKSFTIEGKVNADIGTVHLELGNRDSTLYPTGFNPRTAKIKDGKFTFTGEVGEPVWVQFKFGEVFMSANTAIAAGVQTISIDTAMNNEVPENNNLVMKDQKKFAAEFTKSGEKRDLYAKHSDSLSKIYGSKFPDEPKLKLKKELKESYALKDAELESFVKENPNSYYALYQLYNLVPFGYNSTLGNVFVNFSSLLRGSKLGQATQQRIRLAKPISVGEMIPTFKVVDVNGGKKSVGPDHSNKYTLIDFWYSHCNPRISQFEELKAIRSMYKNKGFEIVGISTDDTKYVKDWKPVIAQHKLSWPQYLDLNGIEAIRYDIHVFPTSLLVNQEGKIVASGLSPIELKDFLQTHL